MLLIFPSPNPKVFIGAQGLKPFSLVIFVCRNMGAVLMEKPKLEAQISKAVTMQHPVKILYGDAVRILYIQLMVQILKDAV